MDSECEVQLLVAADCLLGEGVVWDAARQCVWFVDIKRQRLWQFDPEAGSSQFTEAPAQIGWALPSGGGPLLCGLQDGLYLFDCEARRFEKLSAIPGEPAGNRLNDAGTDPWGRVWFGSMDDGESAVTGRFYVFDRGDIRPAGPTGIAITNGPAINAQGDRIYFVDTARQKVLVADLSVNGVGEARPFLDTRAVFPDAFPDGPVVDAEDHVWIGFYHGACVARFSPDGRHVATIPMPARDVTKMALGGPDLATGYVTSATKNMDSAAMAEYPKAGSLFGFAAPVRGFAQAAVKLG